MIKFIFSFLLVLGLATSCSYNSKSNGDAIEIVVPVEQVNSVATDSVAIAADSVMVNTGDSI